MPKKRPDARPTNAPETTPDTGSPVKTADAIRAALRNKAGSAAARGRDNPYGSDQRPPPAPYGTRRSMGKR